MTVVHRVLDAEPVADLASYLNAGGGRGLAVAAAAEPDDLIEIIADAGLRGRGGAGFPTGIKWRTVADSRGTVEPTAVVVNAAEGEPGTFKDRAIIRRNPYRVLEGALIAARAVGAPEVIVATKASFRPEIRRLRATIAEFAAEGLYDIEMRIVEGPSDYLFGEESALLEVVEGRYPFPRVTPPYRRGLDDPNVSSGNRPGRGRAGRCAVLVGRVVRAMRAMQVRRPGHRRAGRYRENVDGHGGHARRAGATVREG